MAVVSNAVDGVAFAADHIDSPPVTNQTTDITDVYFADRMPATLVNLAKPCSVDEPERNDRIPLAPGFTSTGALNWQLKNGLNGGIRYRY